MLTLDQAATVLFSEPTLVGQRIATTFRGAPFPYQILF